MDENPGADNRNTRKRAQSTPRFTSQARGGEGPRLSRELLPFQRQSCAEPSPPPPARPATNQASPSLPTLERVSMRFVQRRALREESRSAAGFGR
ncbi:hypothetical protein L915_02445, partial [Phytophthora nicotianae]